MIPRIGPRSPPTTRASLAEGIDEGVGAGGAVDVEHLVDEACRNTHCLRQYCRTEESAEAI